MGRSVKVDLILDAMRFNRGGKEAAATTKALGGALDDTADSAAKTGRALDEAGDEMSEAARAAAALDRQIDELTGSLRNLAVAQALGLDVGKQLRDQEKQLRAANKGRKLIGVEGMGAGMAEEVSVTFAQRLGPLLARAPLGPAGIAIGGIIGTAAAPVIGGALAAGIIGGAGGAGIVGGITLAAKDARVKSAASDLKSFIGNELQQSAQPMVPAVLKSLSTIRAGFAPIRDDLDDIFAGSANLLQPLTDGALMGVTRIVDGIRDVVTSVDGAGPVFAELGHLASNVGDAVGDVLEELSDNGDEAAAVVRLLGNALADGVRGIGELIEVATSAVRPMLDLAIASANFGASLYGWIPILGDHATEQRDNLLEIKAALDSTVASSDAAAGAAGPVADSWEDVSEAARDAQRGVKDFDQAIRDLIGTQLSMDEANLAVKQGFADLNAALKDGKRTLADNTQAGRDNRAAILDQIGVLEVARQAQIDNGVEVGTANRRFDQQVAAIGRTAEKLGFNKKEVEKLIAAYRNIPGSVNTNVNANTRPAVSAVDAIVTKLRGLDGKTVTTYIRTVSYSDGSYRASSSQGGGGRVKERWGGIREGYVHAQEGMLREAGLFSTAGPARYAFAEPATGGEAFIPRFGDTSRSRDIATHVVNNWLGGQVSFPGKQPTWNGAGGGVTYVTNNYVSFPGSVVASPVEAERWLAPILDRLKVVRS